MLTGKQLREARHLLGLQRSKLAERMSISRLIIELAESVDGECPITVARARQVQVYLEKQGLEFLTEGSEQVVRFARKGTER